MDLGQWTGKVAVVTGASGGIGAAVARMLASNGLNVVLAARRRGRLEALSGEIHRAGGRALPFPVDLADERERVELIDAVHEKCGPIDVLINNAGFGCYGYGWDAPWAVARQMIRVNVEAVVHLTLLAMERMRLRGLGHVINVGSIAGSLPNQGISLYSASKSYLDSFSTALYRELKGTGVHVSVVRPGAVKTDFFDSAASISDGLRIPAERLGVSPERVAAAVWSLLNRPRRCAYVPGVLRLAPALEFFFSPVIDRLGPLLLRRQIPKSSPQREKRP